MVALHHIVPGLIVCVMVFGGAPVHAQGMFDMITSVIVDSVNATMGASPEPEVRRLQTDAVRIALRGNEQDWRDFVDSATGALGSEYRTFYEDTRSVVYDVAVEQQRVVQLPAPRYREFFFGSFATGGYHWEIGEVLAGEVDDTGKQLTIVWMKRSHANPEGRSTFDLENAWGNFLYVFEPVGGAYGERYVIDLGWRWPQKYADSVGPIYLVDVDGDGIHEILVTLFGYVKGEMSQQVNLLVFDRRTRTFVNALSEVPQFAHRFDPEVHGFAFEWPSDAWLFYRTDVSIVGEDLVLTLREAPGSVAGGVFADVTFEGERPPSDALRTVWQQRLVLTGLVATLEPIELGVPSSGMLASGVKLHVIAPGDTLGRIAQRYGTTVERLARLNEIHNPNLIEVGQVIRLE
jgi:LysM repeat protein